MKKLVFICLFAFILSGCGGSYRIGGISITKKKNKKEVENKFVSSYEEVDVFIKSAPKGFVIHDNRLFVNLNKLNAFYS